MEEDRAFIAELADAGNVLSVVLSDILRALTKTRETLSKVMSELDHRVRFHLDRGLGELKYTMAHDFVRGWEVMEERYLVHVAANFYDVPNTFQHVLHGMNESLVINGHQQVAMAAWLLLDGMLTGRMFLASSAKDSISRADTAYKTGRPLLNYTATIDRRYDFVYMSVGLLQEGDGRQNYYFSKIAKSLDQILLGLNTMQDLGRTFVDTGQFDWEAFKVAEARYISGCKAYNYRLFQLKERVIKSPVAAVDGKIEAFLRVNRSLSLSHDHLMLSIHNVESTILLMQTDYGSAIKKLIADSWEYLSNATLKKTPVAEQITSRKMNELIQKLEVFFTEVRERLRGLSDSWQQLQLDVENIWSVMLNEHYLDEFYGMINEDYLDFKANTSEANKAFYLRIFAYMLRLPISDLGGREADDFLVLLNADFHGLSLSEKVSNIREQFSRFVNDTASTEQLRGADDHFLKAFQQYRETLATFLENSHIGLDFYG